MSSKMCLKSNISRCEGHYMDLETSIKSACIDLSNNESIREILKNRFDQFLFKTMPKIFNAI